MVEVVKLWHGTGLQKRSGLWHPQVPRSWSPVIWSDFLFFVLPKSVPVAFGSSRTEKTRNILKGWVKIKTSECSATQIEDNNQDKNLSKIKWTRPETPPKPDETVVSWMTKLAGMTSMTPRLCRHLLTRCRTSPTGCQSTVSLSLKMPEELSITTLSVSKRQLSSTTGKKVF